MLKAVRNAAASAAAWTLYRAPALEAPYAYAAHAALGVPGVHTLFRETTDRLVARLVNGNRALRRVRIGPVSPVFDVSSFTVKGRYFARVAYEPGATGRGAERLSARATCSWTSAPTAATSPCWRRSGSAPAAGCLRSSPTRRSARQLERHVELNQIADRVTVSGLALAGEDKDDVRLFVSCWPENDGIASLTPAAETLARGGLRADVSIPVSVRRFDTWAQSARPARIDVMKIDVEGAEAQVLAGMSAAFESLRPARIICETPLESDAVRMLRDRGYRVSTLDEIPGGIPNLLFE